MIEPVDVCAVLKELCDTGEFSLSELLSVCKAGLEWVRSRLKEEVSEENPLVLTTAAAMARFFLFIKMLSQPDDFGSLKVGDMTIKRDFQKEFEIEKELKNQAIVDAAEILKDGGFCFCVN
ncbi:MAG: hypothetical protein IJ262_04340 [Clostridia bacterium]|nr:hypothetical protein [Clostridia bacterium]